MVDSSNPMSVEHYSAKLEFQGRGAAHNHGVLWLNLDKLEHMFEKLEKDKSLNPIEYNLLDFDKLFQDKEGFLSSDHTIETEMCA